MADGGAFESFAGTLEKCSRTSLYRWVEAFPEFKDAKAIGIDKSYLYWEKTGKSGMFGQIRRVSKETPMTYVFNKPGHAEDGMTKPLLDNKGNIVTIKEYEQATFQASMWIFNMKNRFGWRDKVEIFDEDNIEGLVFHDGEKVWDETTSK